MYLQLEKSVALNIMRKIVSVAMPNAALPQLAGVFICADAQTGEVEFTTSNIESSVIAVVPAKIKESGTMLVNAALFCNMLKLAGEKTVTLKQMDNSLIFKNGRTQYTIAAISHENYPKPQITLPEKSIKVKNFPTLIRQTGYAAARSAQSDDIYGNLKLVSNKNKLSVTGTDKTHLAHKLQVLENAEELKMLIPLKAAVTFSLMVENDTEVSIGLSARKIVLQANGIMFAANTSGNAVAFLDETAIIKKPDPCYFAAVSGAELCSQIMQIMTVCGSFGTISFNFTEDSIELVCSGELGTAHGNVSVKVADIMPKSAKKYWYRARDFLQAIKAMPSNLNIYISEQGMLHLKNVEQSYVQAPCAKYVPIKKEKDDDKTKKKKAKAA